MKAALAVEGMQNVPVALLEMKDFWLKSATGAIAGSKPVESDSDKHRYCNYLFQIYLTQRVRERDWPVLKGSAPTYGTVLHFSLLQVEGRPLSLAYLSLVRSTRDQAHVAGDAPSAAH